MTNNQKVEFEQMASRCCGLYVHKKEIVATVEGDDISKETCSFSSTTRFLTELKDWLLELGINHVAMESKKEVLILPSIGVPHRPEKHVPHQPEYPHTYPITVKHLAKPGKRLFLWLCRVY